MGGRRRRCTAMCAGYGVHRGKCHQRARNASRWRRSHRRVPRAALSSRRPATHASPCRSQQERGEHQSRVMRGLGDGPGEPNATARSAWGTRTAGLDTAGLLASALSCSPEPAESTEPKTNQCLADAGRSLRLTLTADGFISIQGRSQGPGPVSWGVTRRFACLAATLLASSTASAGTWSIQSQPLATSSANVQPDVAIDGDVALWLWGSLHRSGTTWTRRASGPRRSKASGRRMRSAARARRSARRRSRRWPARSPRSPGTGRAGNRRAR